MSSSVSLFLGDCLELMRDIPDRNVDMILCDLPYGTTRNKWDTVIPFEPLREQYLRILKPNGVLCLHGDQPFTSQIVFHFRDIWRYEMVRVKEKGSDFLNANRKPMKAHETVQICYKEQPTFNKQKSSGTPYKGRNGNHKSSNWGSFLTGFHTDCVDGKRNPTTVLKFNRERGLHPTQKPVALLEYLIRTYTNEGETVLDNCMGSGSTGVACVNTGRRFIGMELDPAYFETAQRRITESIRRKEEESSYEQIQLETPGGGGEVF